MKQTLSAAPSVPFGPFRRSLYWRRPAGRLLSRFLWLLLVRTVTAHPPGAGAPWWLGQALPFCRRTDSAGGRRPAAAWPQSDSIFGALPEDAQRGLIFPATGQRQYPQLLLCRGSSEWAGQSGPARHLLSPPADRPPRN